MNCDLSDRVVLVTGYDGFLGSELVNGLLDRGATVIGLQLKVSGRGSSRESRRRDFSYCDRFHVHSLDTGIGGLLGDAKFRDLNSACFHFAGNPSAGKCQDNPTLAYESNVLLTFDVIDFCRAAGVRKFVFPSTGYVYGNHLKRPAEETDRLLSCNVYTSTKIAAESLIEGYANYYDMDCTIGRISNVYGSGSQPETVTGKIIGCAVGKERIELDSTGPVRDFIHTKDVVGAFLAILRTDNTPRCAYYNISTGVATSIRELAETACRVASLPLEYVVSRGVKQFSDTWLVLDNRKIRGATGWEPEFSVETGLREIL
jgi:nucleoside-diphosphate-sugar epimerase